MNRNIRLIGSSFGLALLYASAYYMPQVGTYWLPNDFQQILYPSIVAVIVLTPVIALFQSSVMDRKPDGLLVAAIVALFCSIAVLGAFSAAGYSALNIALSLIAARVPSQMTRWLRVELVITGMLGLFLVLNFVRQFWGRILRFLSILGYAFALLLIARLEVSPHGPTSSDDHYLNPLSKATKPTPERSIQQIQGQAVTRKVVWIILDELDFNETLGVPGGPNNPSMPNLVRLASIGVSATNAYSPAKDTVASLPSLLTGYPLVGLNFEGKRLLLETRNAGARIFQEADSVFGNLPYGPQSAAILGFYHPYCTVFPSVDPCLASPEIDAGRWFDALIFFGQPMIAAARWLPGSGELLPGGLFRLFEPMYRISEQTVHAFPEYVARQDRSLIFIHVNLPHPPGDYSQRALGLQTVGDDHESYRNNLVIADQLLGSAISILSAQARERDTLLVVSSDHWLRMDSPATAQRVPWIAWHVGESTGIPLAMRINTVHTSDLVLSFLRGSVNSESEIAAWWNDQIFYPSLIPQGRGYQGYGY